MNGMGFLQNYLKYSRALRAQAKAQRELEKTYPPNLSSDFDNGDFADYIRREDQLYEWKRLIQTEYFRNKAIDLNVPMPDQEDKEMYGTVDWDDDPKQPKYLTDKGLRIIRDAIREEKRQRREPVNYWFAIVVGVIGSIAGLISAFK
jgi:hypothetical protein